MSRSLFQLAHKATQLFRERSAPIRDRRTRLQLEPLESRLVPAAWDMTQLALSIGSYPHAGPTVLVRQTTSPSLIRHQPAGRRIEGLRLHALLS